MSWPMGLKLNIANIESNNVMILNTWIGLTKTRVMMLHRYTKTTADTWEANLKWGGEHGLEGPVCKKVRGDALLS